MSIAYTRGSIGWRERPWWTPEARWSRRPSISWWGETLSTGKEVYQTAVFGDRQSRCSEDMSGEAHLAKDWAVDSKNTTRRWAGASMCKSNVDRVGQWRKSRQQSFPVKLWSRLRFARERTSNRACWIWTVPAYSGVTVTHHRWTPLVPSKRHLTSTPPRCSTLPGTSFAALNQNSESLQKPPWPVHRARLAPLGSVGPLSEANLWSSHRPGHCDQRLREMELTMTNDDSHES